MWPTRIAFAIVLIWSAACLTLAGVIFVNLRSIEPPERYIALGLGLVMLYMGGSPLAGLIWPPKAKDPNAPIEVPPLDQVRGRTSYRDDSALARNAMLAIGTIFLAAITTSGSAWAAARRNVGATVEILAIRTYRGGRQSRSVVVARSSADVSLSRDGNAINIRFSCTVPLIATFLIDVA